MSYLYQDIAFLWLAQSKLRIMSASFVSYFGYGSLVNRDTRPPTEEAINATLKGWRRVWNHRVVNSDARRACTSLSIEPADGVIDGVLVRIPTSELAALDERESGYERLQLDASNFILPERVTDDIIHVYRSLRKNRILADHEHPVTQSYVDCVMAGYASRFGDSGLQQFLQSTRGWECPMVADRDDPNYPRSVELPSKQLGYFDSLLARLRQASD